MLNNIFTIAEIILAIISIVITIKYSNK